MEYENTDTRSSSPPLLAAIFSTLSIRLLVDVIGVVIHHYSPLEVSDPWDKYQLRGRDISGKAELGIDPFSAKMTTASSCATCTVHDICMLPVEM
jgi:hypothetical protein